jgi:hypothetical protein
MVKAITYALNQWSGLEAYLKDGRVELDNNFCENTIRPLKIGAKNYLFFGSRRGGELACVDYTLIETCKRHGLDARCWIFVKSQDASLRRRALAMLAGVGSGACAGPCSTSAFMALAR